MEAGMANAGLPQYLLHHAMELNDEPYQKEIFAETNAHLLSYSARHAQSKEEWVKNQDDGLKMPPAVTA